MAIPMRIPKPSWFELFYDLVIAATLGVGTASMIAEPTWTTIGWVFEMLVAVFSIWLMTTLAGVLDHGRTAIARGLVLIQMASIVIATLALGSDEGLPDWWGMVAFGVAYLCVGGLFFVRVEATKTDQHESRFISLAALVAGLIGFVGAMLPLPDEGGSGTYACVIVGVSMLVVMVPVLWGFLPRWFATVLDHEHIEERIGALFIVVLGESFIGLVTKLEGKSYLPAPSYFVIVFLVAYAFWRTYFTSVEPVGLPHTARRARLWLLGHLFVLLGVVSSVAMLVTRATTGAESLTPGQNSWTPLPLFAVVGGMAFLCFLAESRTYAAIHGVAAAALLALAVVALGNFDPKNNWTIGIAVVIVIADSVAISLACRRMTRQEA